MGVLQKGSALWFHVRLATLLLPDQGCLLVVSMHPSIYAYALIHSTAAFPYGLFCTFLSGFLLEVLC